MTSLTRMARLCAVVITSGLLVGCGNEQAEPPPLTPVEGIVTINGQPLPNAEVRFVPTMEGLGSEMIATGVSDEGGHFTLTTAGKPGACVCTHKVVVAEGPAPEGTRSDDRDGDEAPLQQTDRGKQPKNRPIPQGYTNLAQTTLEITVTADKTDYPVELKR